MYISFAKALSVLANGHVRLYSISMDSNAVVGNFDTMFTIAIALTKKGSNLDVGGVAPDIRMWNAECDYMEGMKENDQYQVAPGTIFEVKVHSDIPQQMPYTLITANENAICIATIGVTMVDESAYYWIGDWARECNRDWFYSNIYIQGTDRKTKCQWIDRNHDRPESAFMIHWPSFTMMKEDMPKTAQGEKRLKNFICNEAFLSHKEYDPHMIKCDKNIHKPGFKQDDFYPYDQDLTEGFPPSNKPPPFGHVGPGAVPNRGGPSRRAEPPQNPGYRNNTHNDWLVVTDDPEHSALDLCAHPRSLGPNLVNTAEGSYCHMVDRTVWPVCADETTDDCFDSNGQVLIRRGIQARGVQFNTVLDWSEGAKRR